MHVPRTSFTLLAALICLAAFPPPAAAVEGGVIIPQVDPRPSEGYVDVYYHDCPITGDQPCEHHHVARIEMPCADPSVAGTSASRVVVSNCGETLVDRPVCAPTPGISQATGTVTVSVGGCGVGPVSHTVCTPEQRVNAADLYVSAVTPTGCDRETVEPSGPWAEIGANGAGEYEIAYWNDCDYRIPEPRCYWGPDVRVCVTLVVTPGPTPTYALGECDNPLTGCLVHQVGSGAGGVTYNVGPCNAPVSGTQCVPAATPVNTATHAGATVACGATTHTLVACKPQQTTSTSDVWVSLVTPTGCDRETVEPSGPWVEAGANGDGEYEIAYWNDCDYRIPEPRCYWGPDIALCVTADAAADVPARAVTVTTGDCDGPFSQTVGVPCLATDVDPHADLRGVSYAVGPCAAPITGEERVDDLPEAPGPWVQVGSGGKHPATLWVELYLGCTYDLDDPLPPTCTDAPVVIPLGPFP